MTMPIKYAQFIFIHESPSILKFRVWMLNVFFVTTEVHLCRPFKAFMQMKYNVKP